MFSGILPLETWVRKLSSQMLCLLPCVVNNEGEIKSVKCVTFVNQVPAVLGN